MTTRPVLTVGESGTDVETVQRFLAWHDYFDGPPTGVLDERTSDAIERYQRDHGLQPTGIADAQLWDLIDHGGVAADDRKIEIVFGGGLAFDGHTLTYVGFNQGSQAAYASMPDLLELWWWDGSYQIDLPYPSFHYPDEVKPETSYTGRIDLGPLQAGAYRAILRLNSQYHNSGEVVPENGTVDFVFRVLEDGAQPEFAHWS